MQKTFRATQASTEATIEEKTMSKNKPAATPAEVAEEKVIVGAVERWTDYPRAANGKLLALKRGAFRNDTAGIEGWCTWLRARAKETYERQVALYDKLEASLKGKGDPKAKLEAKIAKLQEQLRVLKG